MYQVGGKFDNIDQIWGKSERKKGIVEQWDEFRNGSDEERNVEQRINEYLVGFFHFYTFSPATGGIQFKV